MAPQKRHIFLICIDKLVIFGAFSIGGIGRSLTSVVEAKISNGSRTRGVGVVRYNHLKKPKVAHNKVLFFIISNSSEETLDFDTSVGGHKVYLSL